MEIPSKRFVHKYLASAVISEDNPQKEPCTILQKDTVHSSTEYPFIV